MKIEKYKTILKTNNLSIFNNLTTISTTLILVMLETIYKLYSITRYHVIWTI